MKMLIALFFYMYFNCWTVVGRSARSLSTPSSSTANANDAYLLPLALQPWEDMSEELINAWYPMSIERCMLRNHTTEMNIKTLYRLCHGKGRRMNNICMPGMGNRGPCPEHPSLRPLFFKALSGYTDPHARPLTSLVHNLQQQKKALVFIGDSAMMQNVDFFICQARRESLVIVADHVDRNCYWRFNITSPPRGHSASLENTSVTSLEEQRPLSVHVLRIGSTESTSMCPTQKQARYRLGNSTFQLGRWKYVKRLATALIENEPGGAFLMMNVGLWYNRYQRNDYARHLKEDFLPFMHDAAAHDNKTSNVVFLESTVQHWSSRAGDFTQQAARDPHKPPFCRALALPYALSLESDWRNFILRRELAALPGSTRVTLLPVAAALAGAEKAHMSSTDCTHLCYFPTLFQFQWHALQLIADQNCIGKTCVLPKNRWSG
mmetsp:Transcript_34951/g.65229  ORF Transcript_34951/g.65229 Transcript_34951/m.65229 type:complete len:435 (-) Transcript_34951:50-1354(-)